MIKVGEKGMEQAKEITAFLAGIPDGPQGIVHKGSSDGKVTDAEKVEYQRDGIESKDGLVVRDITPTEEDGRDAAMALKRRYDNRMMVYARRLRKSKGLAKLKFDKRAAAAAASASGLKDGHALVRDRMLDRIEAGKNSDGSPMKNVTKPYADWRRKKYGVGPNVKLIRSGRLLASLVGPGHLVKKVGFGVGDFMK